MRQLWGNGPGFEDFRFATVGRVFRRLVGVAKNEGMQEKRKEERAGGSGEDIPGVCFVIQSRLRFRACVNQA